MRTSGKRKAESGKLGSSDFIAKFTDLIAWQEGHSLVLAIYKVARDFPAEEQFGLTSQIRRAAISITSNIAEGFSRQTTNDKLHFYTMSLGSLTEVQNQILIAKDVGYISSSELRVLAAKTLIVHKLINGLMKALRQGKGVKK